MEHRSYLLELTSADAFRPRAFSLPGINIVRAVPSDAVRCWRLWVGVGAEFWSARAEWAEARWGEHLKEKTASFWIAECGPEDVGFFELEAVGEQIKIEAFGLMPAWRGRGLGGGLLSAATHCAFDLGARRIWLHTATDDHPNALPNYRKRGYRIYHEGTLRDPMPDKGGDRVSSVGSR